MNQYAPGRFEILPTIVKNLLIINGIMFLATLLFKQQEVSLIDMFGLHSIGSEGFRPYQLITHMFMHSDAGFGHIFFNMFSLWMFGSALENVWGPKRFLTFYFVTGLGASALYLGVVHYQIHQLQSSMSPDAVREVMNNGYDLLQDYRNYTNAKMAELNYVVNTTMVGASGAVYGLLAGFGLLFPNALIYLYFLIPVKAKYLVLGLAGLSLLFEMTGSFNSTAHMAHLGGMVFAFILIKYWSKDRRRFY